MSTSKKNIRRGTEQSRACIDVTVMIFVFSSSDSTRTPDEGGSSHRNFFGKKHTKEREVEVERKRKNRQQGMNDRQEEMKIERKTKWSFIKVIRVSSIFSELLQSFRGFQNIAFF